MIKLPRLYENGKFTRIVHPVSVSITQNMIPLSTATMVLPKGEELPERSYVELFTPYGSAGMFRVSSPCDAYGQETSTADLEHMISEVGNYIVKEETSEMMGAITAFLRAFKYYEGDLWQIGDISALNNNNLAFDVNYDRVLDTLLAILEQRPECMMTFDFSKKPWKINVVMKGKTVAAEGRLSRNVKSATVTYDDTELVTRCWYQKFNSSGDGTWTYQDASTKSRYGIVEGKVSTSSDMTSDEVSATVNAYLEDHKEPRISISIEADELAQITGESMDKFVVGTLCRLALPEYKTSQTAHINSVTWDDVYNSPRSVTVNLGDEEDTVVTFLHNLDSSGSGGGGGGKAKDDEDSKANKLSTGILKTDERVSITAKQTDSIGNILEKAGIVVTSDGVMSYAMKGTVSSIIQQTANSLTSTIRNTKSGLESQIQQTESRIQATIRNTKNNLQSQITQESNRISLVVEGTGSNAKIKPASIVAAINNGESSIVISANHVNLDGLVHATDLTADYFQSKISSISNLSTNNVTVNGGLTCSGRVTGNTLGAMTFELGGASFSNVIVSASVSGNTLTLTPLTGSAITFNRATTLTGSWSGGTFLVSASPQGNTVQTSITGGTAYRDSNWLCIPVNTTDGTYTGKEVYAYLTTRSNATSGLHKYGTTTMYIKLGNDYSSAGSHTWYYKDTDSNLTTWYTFDA